MRIRSRNGTPGRRRPRAATGIALAAGIALLAACGSEQTPAGQPPEGPGTSDSPSSGPASSGQASAASSEDSMSDTTSSGQESSGSGAPGGGSGTSASVPGTSGPATSGTGEGGSTAPSSDAGEPAPEGLDGYRFSSIGAQGRELVAGKPLTIGFGPGSRTALNAGCNGMGGDSSFEGDRLTIDRIISTMMACTEDGVMEQEQWYGTWLKNGVTYSLDGTNLVLRGGAVTVTFERVGAVDAPTSGGAGVPTSRSASHPSIPDEHTPITATSAPVVPPSSVSGAAPPSRPGYGGHSIPAPPPDR